MKGLHHVGITVKDLDASIRFYHDVLGLEFSNEPSPWFEGEGLGDAVGVPGAGLRQVSLILGDSTFELLEYNTPPSETEAPLLSNNIGASHVAFFVDDIHAKKAELEAKGIEFYSDVNSVDEGVLAGWRWVSLSLSWGRLVPSDRLDRSGLRAYLSAMKDSSGPNIAEDRRRLDAFRQARAAVPLDEVKSWVASWGSANELPRPVSRESS